MFDCVQAVVLVHDQAFQSHHFLMQGLDVVFKDANRFESTVTQLLTVNVVEVAARQRLEPADFGIDVSQSVLQPVEEGGSVHQWIREWEKDSLQKSGSVSAVGE